jgi:flagellar basal body-associated protein FliL
VKKILLIALPVAIVAGIAVAVLVVLPGSGGEAAASPTPAPVVLPGEGQHGEMVPIEGRVYNLADGSTYRYVKLQLTLEMTPADAAAYYAAQAAGGAGGGHGGEGAAAETPEKLRAKYAEKLPLIYDAIGQVVAEMDPSQLAYPEGRMLLKESIMAAANEALHEEHAVLAVYLVDLVMQ